MKVRTRKTGLVKLMVPLVFSVEWDCSHAECEEPETHAADAARDLLQELAEQTTDKVSEEGKLVGVVRGVELRVHIPEELLDFYLDRDFRVDDVMDRQGES